MALNPHRPYGKLNFVAKFVLDAKTRIKEININFPDPVKIELASLINQPLAGLLEESYVQSFQECLQAVRERKETKYLKIALNFVKDKHFLCKLSKANKPKFTAVNGGFQVTLYDIVEIDALIQSLDSAIELKGMPNVKDDLADFLNRLLELNGINGASIYLATGESGSLKLHLHKGSKKDSRGNLEVSTIEPRLIHELQKGKLVFQTQRRDTRDKMSDYSEIRGAASVFIPIRRRESIVGVLQLTSDTLPDIPESTKDSLSIIADRIQEVIIE
ncbi:MAG: hypothetical protein GF315_06885 [candidate division Zixibacteria bacterium]|nr:hypothetical protein [candidate division Zixibacteria bacterium]